MSYNAALSEMETSDVIEEVQEVEQRAVNVFYLPHQPVVCESTSSTKVCPVLDGSVAGPNNILLNKCLEVWPSLVPNVVGVMVHF